MSPKLTYLPCRGRIDPILLLFVDAGAPWSLRTISHADWVELKDADRAVPPSYPFGLLPTRASSDYLVRPSDSSVEVPSSGGDKPYVLAESGSILRYVEATLRGPKAPAEQPVARARHESALRGSLSS